MRIGEYETSELLGKGGMSEVYAATHVRLGSRHALKIYAYGKDNPDVRRRFEAEGLLLAKLDHPRIVRVTDVGTLPDGRPYFVMDLVLAADGRPRSLADGGADAADEETVGRWYDDIREGLAYIHGRGIVHRDLKLENILIGPDGHAVLADFGISHIGPGGEGGESAVDPVSTLVQVKDGQKPVMGSIGYMAPELQLGVAASPQSDWYALGVIVYRLLTGEWCDARTDVIAMLETYDPAWTRLVPKLLHANPAGRQCLSFAEERECLRSQRETTAEDALERAERRVRRLMRGIAIGVLAAAALGGTLVAVFSGRPEVRWDEVFRVSSDETTEEADLIDLKMARNELLGDLFDDLSVLPVGEIRATLKTRLAETVSPAALIVISNAILRLERDER